MLSVKHELLVVAHSDTRRFVLERVSDRITDIASGCMRFTGTPLLNTKVSNVKRCITAEINKDGSDW